LTAQQSPSFSRAGDFNETCGKAVDDVAALQAAADKLSPDIIRERLRGPGCADHADLAA
jgi:hypothetical protein